MRKMRTKVPRAPHRRSLYKSPHVVGVGATVIETKSFFLMKKTTKRTLEPVGEGVIQKSSHLTKLSQLKGSKLAPSTSMRSMTYSTT